MWKAQITADSDRKLGKYIPAPGSALFTAECEPVTELEVGQKLFVFLPIFGRVCAEVKSLESSGVHATAECELNRYWLLLEDGCWWCGVVANKTAIKQFEHALEDS